MKKENQRVIITKQMLKTALLGLLRTRHIDRISVTELCEEAGINRSTFYRYYTLPKDILMEMEVDIFSQFRIEKPFQGQDDVRAYLTLTFRYLQENVQVIRILIRNTTPDDYTALMQDFATQLLKTCNVEDLSPEKLRLLLAYTGAGSFYAMRQWLAEENHLSPEELIDFTMDMIGRSIKMIS